MSPNPGVPDSPEGEPGISTLEKTMHEMLRTARVEILIVCDYFLCSVPVIYGFEALKVVAGYLVFRMCLLKMHVNWHGGMIAEGLMVAGYTLLWIVLFILEVVTAPKRDIQNDRCSRLVQDLYDWILVKGVRHYSTRARPEATTRIPRWVRRVFARTTMHRIWIWGNCSERHWCRFMLNRHKTP